MISIFAKPPYENKHLQRVSSIICGEQISSYMHNVRLNPPSGYENDICIFVKPYIKPEFEFYFPKRSWVNINDADALVEVMKRFPKVGIIAYSDLAYKYLSNNLSNKIVLIPQHHLNYERNRRKRNRIKRVGTTGSYEAWNYIPDIIKKGLKERGVELLLCSNFYPRMSVSKFHQNLYIQIHWREFLDRKLSCPFKIINAGSFGVPTIALDEPSFKEVEGSYIGVNTPEEWLEAFDRLYNDSKLYKELSNNGIEIAEKYHIENISKLYNQLDI